MLSWERFKKGVWANFSCGLSGAVMIGVTLNWYHYAKTAPVGVLPLTSAEQWDNLAPIFTVKLWINHFVSRIPELCLTYPGLLLAVVGGVYLYRQDRWRLWAGWLASTAIYIVLLGQYGIQHRYTELPFTPILAVYIACGIVGLAAKAHSRMAKFGLALLIIGIPIHTALRIKHWYRLEYPWVFEARDVLAHYSGRGDLVITNSSEHPVLLYHLHRYGFSPALEELGLDVLQTYRANGARLFLTPADEGWGRHPEWKAWVDQRAELLHQTPDYLLYRLH
jgi:hypothetical protein